MRVRSLIATVSAAAVLTWPVAASAGGYARPGRTRQADLSSSGRSPKGPQFVSMSTDPVISGNGRYVAFASTFSDLVPSDPNGESDIFVRDLVTGRTRLVSHGPGGVSATAPPTWDLLRDEPLSIDPAISANGRFVAFQSGATNLVPATELAVSTQAIPPYRIYVFDQKTGLIRLVSTELSSLAGKVSALAGISDSVFPSIDATGAHIAFTSTDPDLVAHDTNGAPDVFVRDMRSGVTTRVNLTPDGGQSGACQLPSQDLADATGICLQGPTEVPMASVSADGRFVAFDSPASDLVQGDTNQTWDVFVRDLRRHRTERVSVASDGSQGLDLSVPHPPGGYRGGSEISCDRYVGNATSSSMIRQAPTGAVPDAISANGRFVAFCSMDDDLVPNDNDHDPPPLIQDGLDVFVHDRVTGRTERVSVSSAGEQGNAGPGAEQLHRAFEDPAISGNGRFVTFGVVGGRGCAFDLKDPCGSQLVYDRTLGSVEGVGIGPHRDDLASKNDGELSADGRSVVMSADAVVGTEAFQHIWVRDRGVDLGVGGLVSSGRLSVAGARGFAGTGVASATDAVADVGDVLTRAGANLSGASLAYRPSSRDLFVRIRVADMPSFAAVNPALIYGLDVRSRGMAYEVRVEKVGLSASFTVYRRDAPGGWTKIADLRGGYGTTGDEVVFAIPLGVIDLERGGTLRSVEAFAALGTPAAGPAVVLDTETLTPAR